VALPVGARFGSLRKPQPGEAGDIPRASTRRRGSPAQSTSYSNQTLTACLLRTTAALRGGEDGENTELQEGPAALG
jgi:hypothetical protein